jgi:hypothetical protein
MVITWLKKSGIKYLLADGHSFQHSEMLDSLNPLSQVIENPEYPLARIYRGSVWRGLYDAYNVIAGNHYDTLSKGHGRKGVLDILIFPVLVRRLAYYTMAAVMRVNEQPVGLIEKILFLFYIFALCIPAGLLALLETTRVLLAATLTAVVSPLVLVTHALAYFKGRRLLKEVMEVKVETPNAGFQSNGNNTGVIQLTLKNWMANNQITYLNVIKYDAVTGVYYPGSFLRSGDSLEDCGNSAKFKLPQRCYRLFQSEAQTRDEVSRDAFEALNIGRHVRML